LATPQLGGFLAKRPGPRKIEFVSRPAASRRGALCRPAARARSVACKLSTF